ncbi:hypothetical protein HHI36_022715 [Cryptolaemus montrouzieri]|uniref:Cation-transporting ATPase 13A3 n=1 Tax=Cryptolaemus montrouzieri TaxID=559131 RepID=A0ABD2N1F1_9CUCU
MDHGRTGSGRQQQIRSDLPHRDEAAEKQERLHRESRRSVADRYNKEFPFSSSHQRMGVIIRKLNAPNFEYYCKGSPEMLLNFIDKNSLPHNFHEVLENYTQDGCRVIAIAHKEVKMSYTKIQKIQREVLEKDMHFLGLIILENRLKPETAPCIQVLNDANVRIIMVTGDNILTALSVARDCDIIKPGESVITVNCDNSNPPQLYYTLNNFKPKNQLNDFSVLSNSASVMSLDTVESQIQNSTALSNGGTRKPENNCNNYRFAMTGKVWGVVREYYSEELLGKLVTRGTIFARMSPEQKQQLVQELQALGYYVAMCGDGANDCGALKAAHTGVSLSEAESSVASPFTSKNPNISCVINVIKEGRAALVTSFGIFKYMAAYSLCQFISVLILYHFESNLTDMEFLYIDLCIISVFAFFFGKTDSYPGKLVKEPPLTSLLSLSPILSLILQLILIIVFQLGSFWYLTMQPWYTPFQHGTKNADDVGCLENFTIYTISSFQYITLAIVFSKGKPYRKSIFSNIGFLVTSIVLILASSYLALIPDNYVRHFFLLDVPKDFNFSIDKDLNLDTKWPPLTSTTDFTTGASPENSIPTCMAEIVVEKENKFDKNHVLNKLYNRNSTELNLDTNFENQSVCSENFSPNVDVNVISFSTPINSNKRPPQDNNLALKTISDNNLSHNSQYGGAKSSKINISDTNLNLTSSRYPNLKDLNQI